MKKTRRENAKCEMKGRNEEFVTPSFCAIKQSTYARPTLDSVFYLVPWRQRNFYLLDLSSKFQKVASTQAQLCGDHFFSSLIPLLMATASVNLFVDEAPALHALQHPNWQEGYVLAH